MASIKLKNVTKKFSGGVTAVNDLSLDIEDKELIVFVGPSGCGKTTVLRLIAGLDTITEGEIFIADRMVNNVAPKDRDIAMVFQNYALYPYMNVYNNMAFSLKLNKVPKRTIYKKVHDTAKILEIEHLLERKPKALSGGQMQRVALGRAIVREPKVFLMDEPLSNLDSKMRAQMRTEISLLHNKLQTTIIYVTHDQTEAMTIGTRIVVLKDGYVQQVDTPQAIYDRPKNLFVASFMGSPDMNLIDAVIEKQNNNLFLAFGNNKIKIPDKKAKMLNTSEHAYKHVIMGIRPEDIFNDPENLEYYKDGIIDSKVEVIEMLGAEMFLYLDADKTNLTARVSPHYPARTSEVIKVALNPEKIHIFDPDTETIIVN